MPLPHAGGGSDCIPRIRGLRPDNSLAVDRRNQFRLYSPHQGIETPRARSKAADVRMFRLYSPHQGIETPRVLQGPYTPSCSDCIPRIRGLRPVALTLGLDRTAGFRLYSPHQGIETSRPIRKHERMTRFRLYSPHQGIETRHPEYGIPSRTRSDCIPRIRGLRRQNTTQHQCLGWFRLYSPHQGIETRR